MIPLQFPFYLIFYPSISHGAFLFFAFFSKGWGGNNEKSGNNSQEERSKEHVGKHWHEVFQ